MTFDEIVQAVIIDTNRPDMGYSANGNGGDDRIPNRVASCVLQLHTVEGNFFYKDVHSALLRFDAYAYIQTVDTRDLPRYRSLCYFRKWDSSVVAYSQNPLSTPPTVDSTGNLISPSTLNLLEVLTNPNDIFDDYHAEKTDVCYQVGDTIMVKSSSSLNQGLIGWYAYPNVDWRTNNAANFESWIAREYGQAVVDMTTSYIFSTIGKQEQARKYDDPRTGIVPRWIKTIINNNIQPKGY
jgi:hypothetical protein